MRHGQNGEERGPRRYLLLAAGRSQQPHHENLGVFPGQRRRGVERATGQPAQGSGEGASFQASVDAPGEQVGHLLGLAAVEGTNQTAAPPARTLTCSPLLAQPPSTRWVRRSAMTSVTRISWSGRRRGAHP
jgi:hypothetical protein